MLKGLDLLEPILGKNLFYKEVEVLKTDRGSKSIDADGFKKKKTVQEELVSSIVILWDSVKKEV